MKKKTSLIEKEKYGAEGPHLSKPQNAYPTGEFVVIM